MAEFTVEKPGECPTKYPRFGKSGFGNIWCQTSSSAKWVCILAVDRYQNLVGSVDHPADIEVLPPGTKITITV